MEQNEKKRGVRGGWVKRSEGPVLGGELGTCFDVSMLREDGVFRMYFSWRPQKNIAVVESPDGIHWSEPQVCIEPRPTPQGWENMLNRPSVVRRGTLYHMWYTGQRQDGNRMGTSHIFHAISEDGIHFTRTSDTPVIAPDVEWENTSTMNPSVIWEEETQLFKMWYCAGSQYEPRAIGYAESPDGIYWTKCPHNPVFEADPANSWEQHKTAGCQVIRREADYLMFYIGYFDEDYAQIGMAKSPDGQNGWVRFPENPIIAPDAEGWDGDACYKPFAMLTEQGWMLWYNGRLKRFEQIGLALHEDPDLHF